MSNATGRATSPAQSSASRVRPPTTFAVRAMPRYCFVEGCKGYGASDARGEKIRDPLEHPTRYRLYHLVRDNPGIGYREIMGVTDLCSGCASYHLKILESAGLVMSKRVGALIGYFVPERATTPADIVIRRLTERQRAVLEAVRGTPGITQQEVVHRTGHTQPSRRRRRRPRGEERAVHDVLGVVTLIRESAWRRSSGTT